MYPGIYPQLEQKQSKHQENQENKHPAPRTKKRGFPLWGQAGAPCVVVRAGACPLERRADGLFDRPEGQSARHGVIRPKGEEAAGDRLVLGDPKREVDPGSDFVIDQESVIDPLERSVRAGDASTEVIESVVETKKKRQCKDWDNPAIDKLGDYSFYLERDLISFYATHLRAFDSLGWAKRHSDETGRANGFRIGGLSCGNDAHQAGLRNGDVIHAVNGYSVTSIPKALYAYTMLRNDDSYTLTLTRRGEEQTLYYEIGG